MIGGTDIVIPTKGGFAALDACLRVIKKVWPQALFEDAANGHKVDRYELLPIGQLNELFVYRDSNVSRAWDEKGADPSLTNTMLHLLLSDRAVTVVVDDPTDTTIRPLLEAMQTALTVDMPAVLCQDS